MKLRFVIPPPSGSSSTLSARPDPRGDLLGFHAAILDSGPLAIRALLLDFNGTISDDEALLCSILQELFAEQGKPLSTEEYYERLAGLSDPEIVELWLGPGHDDVVARKIELYRERAGDGATVSTEAREAVLAAAERVPVVVVSGSARVEVETVLEAAGLSDAVSGVVAAEDVERGKPAPDGYLRALELLGIAAEGRRGRRGFRRRGRRREGSGPALRCGDGHDGAGAPGGRGRDRSSPGPGVGA